MSGWIRIHRDIENSKCWKSLSNEGRLVMIHILLHCNYKPSEVLVDGELTRLLPGQYITSISTLAKYARTTDRKIRTVLKNLKTLEFMTEQMTKGNKRIITVTNWIFYQDDIKTTKQTTGQRQSNDKATTESEEVKDFEEEKEKDFKTFCPEPDKPPAPDCEEIQILRFWNSLPNLQTHREVPALITELKKCRKKCQFLSLDEINQAITNYNQAKDDHLKTGSLWHSWTLALFLKQANACPAFVAGNPWKKSGAPVPIRQKPRSETQTMEDLI